ncbi:aromatic amino acid DMT transporter YddG [Vibrio sp. La 4.2.2]|uniref:aromatic amino acid DMT transporter YddG n=1 Tax=Vibrio sp. La 4.2.2 TaxID=2998830 RepID=UPI0022CDCB40|nr:aromatic amino acid DMT transporter YddG [Vibrio sp. La 4.2.2]MDA0106785.1 aromatic amino acid DMT transporter YddG [Vibrio sp. La 4.2.2]
MAGLGSNKYTLFGVAAILLWSTLMALTRNIAELFGPIGGAAMLYTVSTISLAMVMGVPKLSDFNRKYLLLGGALFISYEIFLALALGMANDRHQAMEMAVINYLWPALTVLLAVVSTKRKVSALVYPSVLVAFVGVAWCISGDSGLALSVLAANIATNPITYFMAFSAAFIWAFYCNITPKMSNGKNAIVLFFAATAITLWIQYAFSSESGMTFTLSSVSTLLISGVVMGAGYALWNQAIIGGNMVLLATFSYFTPVFSTIFSSFYLSVALGASFWQGVALVTIGSLVCYWATKEKPEHENAPA